MNFDNACIPTGFSWSSPFVRWQGSLADVSSLDLGVAVTADALKRRAFDISRISQLIVGSTVPQNDAFYATPWMAARLGAEHASGPLIAQACATSVACLAAAAQTLEQDDGGVILSVTTDRTSNGPLLIYPNSRAAGGAPRCEHWVLDNFASDPWTGEAMIATAEAVAAEAGFSRQALDDLTLLRYQQYQNALADDRAFQRRYMQPVTLPCRKGNALTVEADEGIQPCEAEGLARLRPAAGEGVVTFASQTHPADGCAGAVVCNDREARALSADGSIARLVSVAYTRAEKARMPRAATSAAQRAVAEAGIDFASLRCVTTHNPFAVNDLWFCQQTGYAAEKMNPYGCSLIYGHPQGPTGMRAIAELIEALRLEGGGYGLFTGCAAGDTGAAMVVRVDD